jgi:hypothetical protein
MLGTPIKLLKVNVDTPTPEIMLGYVGPVPSRDISYPSVIVQVSPDEGEKIKTQELKLPHGGTDDRAHSDCAPNRGLRRSPHTTSMANAGCLADRLGTPWRKGHDPAAARLLLLLQIVVDCLKVVVKLLGISLADLTDLLNKTIDFHRSFPNPVSTPATKILDAGPLQHQFTSVPRACR